jgi:hypothetical protein
MNKVFHGKSLHSDKLQSPLPLKNKADALFCPESIGYDYYLYPSAMVADSWFAAVVEKR